jgi:UDP:flavonoid glycosyltransferase YjiC (YdhE family)
MKYLLSSVGTFGDVAPFVAVGVALRQRGHEVMIAVDPFFLPMVEEAGSPVVVVAEKIWKMAARGSCQVAYRRPSE